MITWVVLQGSAGKGNPTIEGRHRADPAIDAPKLIPFGFAGVKCCVIQDCILDILLTIHLQNAQ
jgi:hypothetical protein